MENHLQWMQKYYFMLERITFYSFLIYLKNGLKKCHREDR